MKSGPLAARKAATERGLEARSSCLQCPQRTRRWPFSVVSLHPGAKLAVVHRGEETTEASRKGRCCGGHRTRRKRRLVLCLRPVRRRCARSPCRGQSNPSSCVRLTRVKETSASGPSFLLLSEVVSRQRICRSREARKTARHSGRAGER